MSYIKELVYKNHRIQISYEEEYGEYLLQVSIIGRDKLLYYATVDEYTDYGEEKVFDKAIELYKQRIEIMEQIG